MSCVNPFRIKNKMENSRKYKPIHYQDYLYVPCGWCLNCRIEKRTFLETATNYYWRTKCNGVGSFLTLTYNDEKILNNTTEKGKFTTRYKDGQNFIKRVREFIRRHNLHDEIKLHKDFKFVLCTEYGTEKERPHIHAIILGIDSKIGEPIFRKHWENGFIQIGELKKGGIRYIIKYMDKIEYGQKAKENEKKTGIERQKIKHSKGIASDFIKDNLDNIKKNNGFYYDEIKDLYISIPRYYCEKYNIEKIITDEKTIKEMKKRGIKKIWNYTYRPDQIYDFKKQNNLIKYKNRLIQTRNKGIAVTDVLNETYDYNQDLLNHIEI